MKCPSGKRRLRTRGDALIALWKCGLKAEANLKSERRQEKRAYECPLCGGWHLTSQEMKREPRTD